MSFRMLAPGHWLAALLVSGTVVLGAGMLRGQSSVDGYFELKRSREVLSETVERLRKENAALSEEILRIKESPSYARKVLRDKYHVTDPDEDIVFFAE
jgi:cell division protein FtsB